MGSIMNKKWSSQKVKEAQRWIIKRWPESFSPGSNLRPLSLNIHKDILAHRNESPLLSSRVVREVLKRHTTSFGYLYGLLEHDHRYDLDNNPAGEVSAEHRGWAKETLRQKQKQLQKVRKEKKQLLSAQKRKEKRKEAGKSLDKKSSGYIVDEGKSAGGGADPVIRYKVARRKIVKPTDESAVELAS